MGSSAVASDTKLETPEGPITVKTVLKSPTAVMTRSDDGRVRFAMTSAGRVIAAAAPVLKVSLDNGRALRVGPEQILLGLGMREVAARDLRPGDRLECVFSFPAGYAYRSDDGEERASDGGVGVSAVEPDGEAELHALTVARTGRFVFSAGVLGKAD